MFLFATFQCFTKKESFYFSVATHSFNQYKLTYYTQTYISNIFFITRFLCIYLFVFIIKYI